jgi:tRNA dimethylallyltransferase
LKKKLIVLAGPTAVGKTTAAIQVAQHYKAEIFSADSRQLYQEMTIGTAKPSVEELAQVKHHFINTISIQDDYDAGRYETEVIAALETYFADKDIAILTGGTGLYLRAVMEGLDSFPPVDSAISDKYEDLFQDKGLDHLQMLLEQSDKAYFDEVDLNNHRRIIRALSVIESTGKAFSEYRLGKRKERNFDIVPILLTRDREDLYDRINTRVGDMIKAGLMKEAKALYDYQDLRALQTVGYSEVFLMEAGMIDLYTAVELIKRNTRRYAKRQMTWFRRNDYWKAVNADSVTLLADIQAIIDSGHTMA